MAFLSVMISTACMGGCECQKIGLNRSFTSCKLQNVTDVLRSMITAHQAHPHIMLKSKISQKLPNKLSSESLSSKLPCGAAKSSLLSHLVTDQVPEQGRTPAVWVAFFPHQLTWWQVAGLWLLLNSFFSTCQILAFTSGPFVSILGDLYLKPD